MSRPYLIVPKLIEQPTWGGEYIVKLKGWEGTRLFFQKKIGQSYELSGASLITPITDTADPAFGPEGQCTETQPLTELLQKDESMPLLIKINQARGNSFQLHMKSGMKSPRWRSKPESWYFLEDGFISLGIKSGQNMEAYKKTCWEIDDYMKVISVAVLRGEKTIDDARREAQTFIQEKNPWQYVNRYDIKKHAVIDLSLGGIHHSWEESAEKYPLGNIIFEVQQDVSDEDSTMRSFDQGKIKDDGSIRALTIDDYFEYLDVDPSHNTLSSLQRTHIGSTLLKTPYYRVDLLEITQDHKQLNNRTFNHLYVRDGHVQITGNGTAIHVGAGHSCCIPSSLEEYQIKTIDEKSTVLKTFIQHNNLSSRI